MLLAAASSHANEAAIMSTIADGNQAILPPTPNQGLPTPTQQPFTLPANAIPHALAFRLNSEMLFADFEQPKIYRVARAAPNTVTTLNLSGRSSANGTRAVDPSARYAISIGETSNGTFGESIVIDFGATPPQITTISNGLRALQFVTAAIDFHADGRAFVCHTGGVSVLSPPCSAAATRRKPAVAISRLAPMPPPWVVSAIRPAVTTAWPPAARPSCATPLPAAMPTAIRAACCLPIPRTSV